MNRLNLLGCAYKNSWRGSFPLHGMPAQQVPPIPSHSIVVLAFSCVMLGAFPIVSARSCHSVAAYCVAVLLASGNVW